MNVVKGLRVTRMQFATIQMDHTLVRAWKDTQAMEQIVLVRKYEI